jgi:uncharacterized OB-fold protein
VTQEKPRFFSQYDEPLWASVEAGRLSLQQCASCNHFRYPPGACCPRCLSTETNWTRVSGKGRLLSWTTFHRQYLPDYPPPVICVAVELEEGPIMIGNIDPSERTKLQLDVKAELFYGEHPAGYRLPRFRLVQT